MKYGVRMSNGQPDIELCLVSDDNSTTRPLSPTDLREIAARLNALEECTADERDRLAAQIREADERAKAAEKERDALRGDRDTALKTCSELRDRLPSAERAERHARELYEDAKKERDKLRLFKSFVHSWLSGVSVPEDPDPEKTQETGCRVQCRLDWLAAQHAARAVAMRAAVENEKCATDAVAQASARLTVIGGIAREVVALVDRGPR